MPSNSLNSAFNLDRQIEVPRPIMELKAPSEAVATPSLEESSAVDSVFAEPQGERNTAVDAINVVAVGMLLHDLVKDTLAPPANEEEDELPRKEPKKPENKLD